MQLPDVVVLCFILNRQSIDGVAKVASAIKQHRAADVKVRAAPMRIAYLETGAEADARARALHELVKIGQMTTEDVEEDFRVLSVRAEPGVPYYETLAPFVASDIATDPLTLNYQRFGSAVLSEKLELPRFDVEWLNVVRRRLQPQNATVEYVSKLTMSDPYRALAELMGLLDSALESTVDGYELPDSYLSMLIDATTALTKDGNGALETYELLEKAIDLARFLATENPDRWNITLATVLDHYEEVSDLAVDFEIRISILEEVYALISADPTPDGLLRRIENRAKIISIYIATDEYDTASQSIGEIAKSISKLERKRGQLDHIQTRRLDIARMRLSMFKGDVKEQKARDYVAAAGEYKRALDIANNIESGVDFDALRVTFDLYIKLARSYSRIGDLSAAGVYCLRAAKVGANYGISYHFADLASIVLQSGDDRLLIDFCNYSLEQGERRSVAQYASYYGRSPRSAEKFIMLSTNITDVIMSNKSEIVYRLITLLVDISTNITIIAYRRRNILGVVGKVDLAESLERYVEVLQRDPAYKDVAGSLSRILRELTTTGKRSAN